MQVHIHCVLVDFSSRFRASVLEANVKDETDGTGEATQTHQLNNLTSGVTYHLKITATNSDGTSEPSNNVVFTTTGN